MKISAEAPGSSARAVWRSIAFNKPCNRHRETDVATAALSASVSLPLPDLATTWKDS